MKMGKIKITQIDGETVVATIDPSTPLELVESLSKSLNEKGLYENMAKSTLSTRYFCREDVADRLIKSLESMTKSHKYSKEEERRQYSEQKKLLDREAHSGDPHNNTWHMKIPGAIQAYGAQRARLDREDRAKRAGIRPNVSTTAPKIQSGPNTLPGTPNKLLGEIGENVTTKKNEESDVEKSGYGPKGAGLYNPADNVKRKMSNTGDQTGFGANVNTKQYTTAKFSNQTPQTNPKLKKPQPVKQYSKEEIAELERQRKMQKAWADHLPFPNAEEEMAKLAKYNNVENGDDALATQLANMMNSKAMLQPKHIQPTEDEFIMAGEQMGLGVSENMVKNTDNKWNNTFNNWLAEASKPISQRFNSEEEEIAYWRSIKIEDKDDGRSGY